MSLLLALLPSHGRRSHGKPLTEVNKKLLMVFLMMPMYKTERSVTGMESGNPFILYCKVANLTHLQKKADADKTKTFAEIKDYYHKGYATDIEMIGIEDGIVEFHRNNETTSCKYDYDE